MSSDTGITFEDVMGLCNIHANLFKGAIADVEVADMDQEGTPVYVFKQENLALRASFHVFAVSSTQVWAVQRMRS